MVGDRRRRFIGGNDGAVSRQASVIGIDVVDVALTGFSVIRLARRHRARAVQSEYRQ